MTSRSTTRHGVSGTVSDRNRMILSFIETNTFPRRRLSYRSPFAAHAANGGEDKTFRPSFQAEGRPKSGQLKLLGSAIRDPRPRQRVPGRLASGQGAMALIGTATISTSLSGPGLRPDCQKD